MSHPHTKTFSCAVSESKDTRGPQYRLIAGVEGSVSAPIQPIYIMCAYIAKSSSKIKIGALSGTLVIYQFKSQQRHSKFIFKWEISISIIDCRVQWNLADPE